MPTCFECKATFPCIQQISFHFSMVHYLNYQPGQFQCGEQNCFFKATYLKCLREHWSNFHKFPKSLIDVPSSFGKQPTLKSVKSTDIPDDPQIPEVSGECSFVEDLVTANRSEAPNIQDYFQSKALQFVSNLYANPNLPRNCVQHVVDNSNALFSGFVSHIKETLPSLIGSLTDDKLSDFNELLSAMENPFQNLETEYQRLNYFKKLGTFIQPQKIFLGVSNVDKKVNGVTTSIPTVMHAEYISAPRLLFNFFCQPEVLRKTLNYMQELKEEGNICISNVIQGSCWKKRFDNCGKIVIPIFFFVDAFEPGNPLGGHAGLHSTSGGYLSIACLPPKYKGCLDNIFVTLLFNSQDRKDFGNDQVFKPLIADLKNLEEDGLFFCVPSFKGKVFFALANLLGDNLGLHEITDFSGSFTAMYPCRWCKATKAQTTLLLVENQELMRNVTNYNEDVASKDFKSSGIHKASIWNTLPSYHIVDGPAPDLSHDGPEGVCNYVMVFVISDIVKTKSPDLNTLNLRIKNFDYGPCVTNKPPLIDDKHLKNQKLRMSASEMLCLVRFFSLIIGDLVPERNLVWDLYLKLKKLMELLLAPVIQKDAADLMELYIKELNSAYLLLSGETLKNKFHHLTHYPGLLRKLGPSVNLWAIRYDGKHRISKRNANIVASRVDPLYTFAVNSQLNFQSCILSHSFLRDRFEWGLEEVVSLLDEIPMFPKYLLENRLLSAEGLKVPWVKCHGTRYAPQMVLIYDLSENLPDFAKIVSIFVANTKILFKCCKLEVIDVSEHYGCYEVHETENLVLVEQENLIDPIPTCVSHNALYSSFVTIRHVL